MKKFIFKNSLFTIATILTLAGLFVFTFYYFSHDTTIIPDYAVADTLMVADDE